MTGSTDVLRRPATLVVELTDESRRPARVRRVVWRALLRPRAVRTVTVGAAPGPAELHEILKRLGPVDALLDFRRDGFPAQHARFERLLFHVRSGGLYVLFSPFPGPPYDAAAREWGLSAAAGDSKRVTEAVASVRVRRRSLVVNKQLTHRLKARDHEVDDVIGTREPNLRITELTTLPGGRFHSRSRVHQHPSERPLDWPGPEIEYPSLHLRRYDGEIAFHGGTLMHTGLTILPDSFRWHLSADPSNPNTVNVSPDFARIEGDALPRRRLDGSFYQLDPQYGGFGHVMTEVVGRLWGWDRAKAEDPDLKALFHVVHRRSYRSTPRYRVLRGWGIEDADIVAVNRPVLVPSMTSGTVMWHNSEPFYVHPGIDEVWDRLADGLIADGGPTAEKIFISRSPRFTRRTCRNAADVEKEFSDRGFAIVYPEDLDLGEQVALFRNARVVAGFGGSGLFNVMFARELECMIVLTHDAYYHRNEHLFTAVRAADAHYFWSASDIAPEDTTDHYAAVESSWSFDFARHGEALRSVLGGL